MMEKFLMERFLIEKNRKMRKVLTKMGVNMKIREEIMEDMETWRQKGLNIELDWETRHKDIWQTCGCIIGERVAEFNRKVREGGMREDRKITTLRKSLTWIAVEFVMAEWMELGMHEGWHRNAINIHNIMAGSFCKQISEVERSETKWIDPRGKVGKIEKMSEEKRWSFYERLYTGEERMILEGDEWNWDAVDEWEHWSCCGLLRGGEKCEQKGGKKRKGEFLGEYEKGEKNRRWIERGKQNYLGTMIQMP